MEGHIDNASWPQVAYSCDIRTVVAAASDKVNISLIQCLLLDGRIVPGPVGQDHTDTGTRKALPVTSARWRSELAELRLLVRRCLRACPLAGIAQAQFNLSRTNSAQSLCPVS